MSCLDVMYPVYAPQPCFPATFNPYHRQKLAFYPKMQEGQESSAFPPHPASIKEEDCVRDKEQPREAEYLSSRCVLFTYFQGDISSVVDEHFSRALSQPGSYLSGTSGKSARGSAWRDGSFPMSQRSFPPSFWNSAYQPSVPASLGSPLGTAHTELPFPGDPYASASLHSHLHQASAESWHPGHHHHPHPYSLGSSLGGQGSAYPRTSMHEVYSAHFDPRYGSLLVPSVRPHRLTPAAVGPTGNPQCDIGKGDPAGSAWTGPFASAGSDMGQSLSLNMDAARRYSLCGRALLS